MMEDSWDWVQEELKKMQDDLPADPEMMQVVDAISVADFWKRRYDEEQMSWERKLGTREDEKRELQSKAQEHEMAIRELDFKLKEIERRWQQEKLLLEDRLRTKEAEITLTKTESQLDKRLQALETENEQLKQQLSRAAGVPLTPYPMPVVPVPVPQPAIAPAPAPAGASQQAPRDEEALKRLEKLEQEKNEVAKALAEKEKSFVVEKEQWEKAEIEVKQIADQMQQRLRNLKEREEEHFIILEDLARGFAHRVRNYLGIMSGTVQLSLVNYKMEPELEEQLKVVDGSVQDMLKSIEDFLSLARIPQLNLQPLDLNQMLEALVTSLDGKCRAQNITVTRNPGSGLPLFKCDHKLFNEAFQHLLENAIEAMPNGGQLTMSTAFDAARGMISLKIIDTGVGISDTHIKKVFQPYFTSKKNHKGLGLTIAKRVADLHHGLLMLESAKGKGTTIAITLYMDEQV
jgi:signal transduction histidine kinase